MSLEPPVVLQFGSRMGSYLALVLSCAVFVVLSLAIADELTRGARLRRRTGWLLGSLVFGVLTATAGFGAVGFLALAFGLARASTGMLPNGFDDSMRYAVPFSPSPPCAQDGF